MRAEGVPVLVVNAGNLLFKRESLKENQIGPAQLTAELIVSSYNIMGCDALNVGAYDLSLGVDFLLRKRADAAFPIVSANLVDKHDKLLFSPQVIQQVGATRVGIFGLIDSELKIDKIPGSHKIAVRDPLETARIVVPELRKQGADLVVLLTDMTSRSLRRLAQLGLPIDLIVGSDEKNEVSLPIVVQGTYITHLDRGGKSVGRLDIAAPTKTAGDRESEPYPAYGTKVRGRLYQNTFVQLRLAIPDHPKIGPMVADVIAQISETQRDSLSTPSAARESDCGTRYVGVETCARCHPGRHKAWLTTDHSRAYQALVEKNRQYDDECIVCHSLAFQCDLGAPNIETIGAFANVQCESCHGPGERHVQTRGKQAMVVAKRAAPPCFRCHTPEKSDDSGFLGKFKDICTEIRR